VHGSSGNQTHDHSVQWGQDNYASERTIIVIGCLGGLYTAEKKAAVVKIKGTFTPAALHLGKCLISRTRINSVALSPQANYTD
jgi:hypothetical protein